MFFMDAEGKELLNYFEIFKVGMVILGLFVCHWFMRNSSVKEMASKQNPYVLGVFWAVMVFLICIAQGTGEQFIYFQF